MKARIMKTNTGVLVAIPTETLLKLTRDCDVSIAGERLSITWGYGLADFAEEYRLVTPPDKYRALLRKKTCRLQEVQLNAILNALTIQII